MRVQLNGGSREIKSRTIDKLLQELAIQPERVAVELNFQIVKRTAYGAASLKEGDQIEIVHMVGGG